MCPITNLYLFLIILGVVFGIYWFSRQYKHVKENFNTIAKLLESPKITSYFFNFIVRIEGLYKGRKAGWGFHAYQTSQDRCTWLYVEPNCKIKRRYICITNSNPTKNTVLRGKKIYFIREAFQDTIIGGTMRDKMPLYSAEDIGYMLNELSGAAEILETREPKSLSIPIKERLFKVVAIIAAIIFMFIMLRVFILDALSRVP